MRYMLNVVGCQEQFKRQGVRAMVRYQYKCHVSCSSIFFVKLCLALSWIIKFQSPNVGYELNRWATLASAWTFFPRENLYPLNKFWKFDIIFARNNYPPQFSVGALNFSLNSWYFAYLKSPMKDFSVSCGTIKAKINAKIDT